VVRGLDILSHKYLFLAKFHIEAALLQGVIQLGGRHFSQKSNLTVLRLGAAVLLTTAPWSSAVAERTLRLTASPHLVHLWDNRQAATPPFFWTSLL
jgi:hypothetical protein